MNKYFPIYVAILAVVALLLFLSPQISSFISADTIEVGREILKNNDFTLESLNNSFWLRKTNNELGSIKTESGGLLIRNNPYDKEVPYILLSQRIVLQEGKTYRLRVNFELIGAKVSASTGIQKNGAAGNKTLSYSLSTTELTLEKYFKSDDSFKDPYFYIFVQGEGSLRLNNLSLVELDMQDGIQFSKMDADQIPIAPDTKLPPSPPVIVPASQTPSATITPSPAASASTTPPKGAPLGPLKTPIASVTAKKSEGGEQLTFYPGWNAIGVANNMEGKVFKENNLTAYQMLAREWSTSMSDNAVFSAKTGVIVYSHNKEIKQVIQEKTDTASKLAPGVGWNLLYNDQDQAISSESAFPFSKNDILKDYKLEEMVNSKQAAKEVYLVSSNEKGMIYKKISFPKEAIPAKTVFWFYIFALPAIAKQ